MRPKLHPQARRELRHAADGFGERVEGGGARFIRAVRATVRRTLATPHAGSLWPGLPPALQVRRRQIRGFKYMSIACTAIDDVLWIVAIVPDRKRPGYWFERVGDLPER
jgi:plasmid stabilization system protein ParE